MTTKECLTKFLLSRFYNEQTNSVVYRDVCNAGYGGWIHYRDKIDTTYKNDKIMYNVMYPYCKKCKYCDSDDLPRINLRAHKKYTDEDFENGHLPDSDSKVLEQDYYIAFHNTVN